MERLKEIIYLSFFTQLLMLLSALVACILSVVHRKKFPELKFMGLYPMASLVQGIVTYYTWIFREHRRVDLMSESLFIACEFIILYFFFQKIIILRRFKLFIRIIFFSHITYMILMWTFADAFHSYTQKIYLVDSLCVLSFCFIYLFQLFKLPPELNLLNNPTFWITIGCLFYFSCTIPLFFAESILGSLPQYHTIYSINFLAYTFLFMFISKAFLCTPTAKK